VTVYIVAFATYDGDHFLSVWSTREKAEQEVEWLGADPYGMSFVIIEAEIDPNG
jgi:hypothetical protein